MEEMTTETTVTVALDTMEELEPTDTAMEEEQQQSVVSDHLHI